MKNYFIANGEVLNTNMSAEEIELRVQESLDESTSGMAQFRIKENSEGSQNVLFIKGFSTATLINQLFLTRTWPLDKGVGIGAFQLQAGSRWIPDDTSIKICREELLFRYLQASSGSINSSCLKRQGQTVGNTLA